MASDSPVGHPSEWPVVQLSDITSKIGSGSTPRGGEETYLPRRSNFALVRSQNVFDRHFDTSGLAFISDEQAESMKGVILQPKDLLLNITGDGITFSRCCVVPSEVLPACVNQHVAIIRVKQEEADSGYVLSYLTHPATKAYIESFNAGGSRRAITKGHIESFRIALPPLVEQRAIAHVLDTLDDKIELNRRMNETLDSIARALFKSWFVDFDPVRSKAEGGTSGLSSPIEELFPDSFQDSDFGEIPKGWRVGVLDELTQFVIGGDWGAEAATSETPELAFCIRGADIPELQRGGFGKMPKRFLKKSSLTKRQLQNGDLVIEISGGSPTQSTGRPVLISEGLLSRRECPLVCSNFCRLLRLKGSDFSKFIYTWFRWLYDSNELLQFENGTTGIKNFAFTLFSSTFKLVIPAPEVLKAFDSLTSNFFHQQQVRASETETLAGLRDALLSKLISGELRVPDAERIIGRQP